MNITNKKSSLDRRENLTAFLFILVPLIGFMIFTLISLIISVVYSFTNFNPVNSSMKFIKFDNYISLFTNPSYSADFMSAIGNTLFMLIGLPIGIALSTIIGILMNDRRFKGKAFFRGLIYLPAVTSVVAINYIWKYIFHDNYGILNAMFGAQTPWLTDNTLIKVAIIIKNIWAGMGVQIILVMAGMQNISECYYEAADLDGASGMQKFFKITLPMLTPVVFYMIITGLIGGLQAYADTQLFANGHFGSRTIVYFVWMRGIDQNRYGFASSAAMLLAVCIMLITIVQFKFSKWVYSE